MQRLYSLGETCALFAINEVTRRRANISPHADPSDHRRRYLDSAQLLEIAQLHQRVLVPLMNEPYTELVQLRKVVAQLVQRVERLETMPCCCSAPQDNAEALR